MLSTPGGSRSAVSSALL